MNDVVFNDLRWPIEETCQAIWDVLQDHGRIKWKQTFWDLEKALDEHCQPRCYVQIQYGLGSQRSCYDPK